MRGAAPTLFLVRNARSRATRARLRSDVKQLDAYEAAVMAKRLEELPPGELERLMEEVESDKAKIAARNAARGGENPLLKRD